MSSEIIYINGDFDEKVLKCGLPVLVDFYADWCGPCRTVGPLLESIANKYKGRIRVVKVNIDNNPDPSHQYSVRSIPTFMIFQGGQVVNKRMGAMTMQDLESFIQPYLTRR